MVIVQRQYLLDKVFQAEIQIIFLLWPKHFEAEHLPQNFLGLLAIRWRKVRLDFKVYLYNLSEIKHLKRLDEVAEFLEVTHYHLNFL